MTLKEHLKGLTDEKVEAVLSLNSKSGRGATKGNPTQAELDLINKFKRV